MRLTVREKVFLQLVEEGDAGDVFILIDTNRQSLGEWLPWVASAKSEEDTLRFIRFSRIRYAAGNGFDCLIISEDRIAGIIGLHEIDQANRSTRIGYWLGKEFEGKGLVTDACRILLDHCFHFLNLNRVEIRCATENFRSRKVPGRLGFKHEGVLREAEWLNNTFVDLDVFGMLKSHWPDKPTGPVLK